MGCGGIGRTLLKLLEPFEVRTLALTRAGGEVPGAAESFGPDGLDRVVAGSYYIVVAAPATAETRAMISSRQLARMRPGAWLINVSRGTLVDTDALVAELRAGRIGGAALDVTDPEPLPDGHPLWQLPNVIITPHVSSTPDLGAPFLARRVQENVERFARGEQLSGVIDLAAGY